MIVAKFSTLRGGCFIEQRDDVEYSPSTRCFRFDSYGNAEWAAYGDLISNNPTPRWYHHSYSKDQFIFV